MPAAPVGRDRRARAPARPSAAAERSRARGPRAAVPTASKLNAARGVALTPIIAAGFTGLLALLILVAALATDGRAARVGETTAALFKGVSGTVGALVARASAPSAPLPAFGPRLASVHLEGASAASRAEIQRAIDVHPGMPMFGIDLQDLRARVESVGWVASARVIRLWPDTLVIAVTERPLMAIWQHGGRRDVVAADGHVVAGVTPGQFASLPLVIGEGANDGAGPLLAAVTANAALRAHVRAIRRVDLRRWDLLLKDGGVVQLSADAPDISLARLERLNRLARVLDLGLARIDLRNANFTVVRPRAAPAATTTPGV